jgi:hypothetical protein
MVGYNAGNTEFVVPVYVLHIPTCPLFESYNNMTVGERMHLNTVALQFFDTDSRN